MKKRFLNVLRVLICALCALAVAVGGVLIGYLLPKPAAWVAIPVFAAILVLMAVNLVLFVRFSKKYKDMSARQVYDYTVKVQEEMEKDYLAAERAALRSIARADGMLAVMIVLCFLLCMFIGAARAAWTGGPITVLVLLLYSLFGLAVTLSAPLDQKNYLREKDYPLLYATVMRAAQTVGYKGKIRIELSVSIGVSEVGNGVIIGLKSAETALLTREELYTVMLHEFAHVVNVDTGRSRKFARAKDRFSDREIVLEPLCDLFFCYYIQNASMNIMMYESLATRHHEMLADEKVRVSGNAQTYINATAKAALFALYDAHPFRETRYDCYAGETPPENLVSLDLATFRSALERYGERWRQVLADELPARIASHPTFKQRMQAMGVDTYDSDTAETDENYISEMNKLIAFANRQNCEAIAPQYERAHKEAYLSRKKQMEKYEKSVEEGKELSLDQLVRSMQAFYIVDNEKALAVADKLLAADPDSAYAHLYRGNIFFDELDSRCVEEFRAAMCANHRMVEYCLEQIGQFALLSGNEQLLQEYRASAPETAQEAYDREKQTEWTKKIPLHPTALPAAVLESIGARLNAMGEDLVAVRAYAADFGPAERPCTLVAVEFPRGIRGPLLGRNMDDLYEFLDSRPEDYTLFLYDKEVARALRAAGVAPFWEG